MVSLPTQALLVAGLLQFLGFCCLFAAAKDFANWCDIGPDALSDTYSRNIPHKCIQDPYGGERCYYTYIPDSCYDFDDVTDGPKTKKVPLVMDIHGFGVCPWYQAGGDGWMQQAEKDCFVLVWPLGSDSQRANTYDGETCWNLPGFLRSDDYGNGVATYPACCFEPRAPNDPPPRDPDDPLVLTMIIDSVVESISEWP